MAKRIESSKEVRKVIQTAIASGAWHMESGKKHNKIRHTSGRIVSFAASPGDNHRGALNLQSSIRHIEDGRPGWGIAVC